MKGGCGGFPLVLLALGSPEASDHNGNDILSYAEGPDPCDAGWAGCCVVPWDWEEEGGEPVCSCAWNWASCSGLASVFSRVFSCSSWEFFSISSLICSLRTSTSSLTAYIKWLFTRSWKAEESVCIRKAAPRQSGALTLLSWGCSELVQTQPCLAQRTIPTRATSPLSRTRGQQPFSWGSGAGQSTASQRPAADRARSPQPGTAQGTEGVWVSHGDGTRNGGEGGVRETGVAHVRRRGAQQAPPPLSPAPGARPRPPRTGCSQFSAQVAAFPSLLPALRGRGWRQSAARPMSDRVIYSRELKARSLPSNSRQSLPWERLQAPLQ